MKWYISLNATAIAIARWPDIAVFGWSKNLRRVKPGCYLDGRPSGDAKPIDKLGRIWQQKNYLVYTNKQPNYVYYHEVTKTQGLAQMSLFYILAGLLIYQIYITTMSQRITLGSVQYKTTNI